MMLRKRKIVIVLLAVGFLALLAVFQYVPAYDNVSAEDKGPGPYQTESGRAAMGLWADLSVPELFGYSDLVVTGEVAGISPARKGALASTEDSAVVYKDYSFVVQESFKGDIEPGALITIRVLGGQVDGLNFEAGEAVAPDTDHYQLFFLKENNYFADSQETTYGILTPRGKFILDPEKNSAMNELEESQNLNSFMDELNKLRQIVGTRIILPAGFIE